MKGKLALIVLRHHRKLRYLKGLKFGEFEIPTGEKYRGVKFTWRW